ncbi:MAG: S-layer homology domain-containing protein, partial [Firmicutes bacterium]|nr:S-layer homology domain-containing protein [Bacillota bacterium]
YEWLIMDMAAYTALPGISQDSTSTLQAVQDYLDYTINSLAEQKPSALVSLDSIYAKAVLGLSAIGVEPTNLITLNKTALNAIALLKLTTTTSIYNAPYVLLAYQQGNYNTSFQEQNLINFLLAAQLANGAWGWGDTADTADTDGTAMVIQALAKYYNTNKDIAQAIDKAVTYLSAAQNEQGAYVSVWTGEPSADTMAQVILALTALGLDFEKDTRFIKEHSLLSGLLSLKDSTKGDFFGDSNEQAFRALIAVMGYRQQQAAYNFYDFSHNKKRQGIAVSLGGAPLIPLSESAEMITVSFTLEGPEGKLIEQTSLSVPADAKVYHIALEVLAKHAFLPSGAENGYISSVTKPNGIKYSEFEYGPNSGWLYKVNNKLPGMGITSCEVYEGDDVLLYYSKNWLLDADAGSFFSAAYEGEGVYFSDVPPTHWAAVYIYDLVKNGIIKGKTPSLFAPQDNLTRAELTVLLFRMSRETAPLLKYSFDDVSHTAWYAPELAWAVQEGIIEGMAEKRFAPQKAVNRQDMAVMLYRFIGKRGFALPPQERIDFFSDEGSISQYAIEAVAALHLGGLIKGYEDNSFRPKAAITRAEAAKLLASIAGIIE